MILAWSPTIPDVGMFGPQWDVLLRKAVQPLRGGSLLEEVGDLKAVVEFYSPVPLAYSV